MVERFYIDTSAYLCIQLEEAGHENLLREIADAGLVSSVVLLGGFVVNFVWCLFLNVRNRTAKDYVGRNIPILPNLILAAIAGAIWCSQFICFTTGEPKMESTSYIGCETLEWGRACCRLGCVNNSKIN